MSSENKALADRVARLEAKISSDASQPEQPSVRKTLLAEIEGLEGRLGMSYMDDDDMEPGCGESGMAYMDEDLDDVGIDDLDMEPVIEEEVVIDEDFMDDDDMEPGCMQASEAAPGIEDQITQDSLSEVEDLRGKEGLATQPDAEAAARNTTPPEGSHPMWASYAAKLRKASAHLDKVSDYVEKSGDKNLALRIDKIADAIDKRADKAEAGRA